MKNFDYSLFRSRTFWTVVAMAVVGGGNAIIPVIPPTAQTILELFLAFLASQFHLSTARKFGGKN